MFWGRQWGWSFCLSEQLERVSSVLVEGGSPGRDGVAANIALILMLMLSFYCLALFEALVV